MKLNLKFLSLMAMIILFFKPLAINSLEQFSQLDTIWDLGRIFVSVVIVWKVIFKKHIITKDIFMIIMLEVLFCFSTLINNGDIRGLIVNAISIISFTLIAYYYIEKDALVFFKAMFYGLSTLILIHFVVYLLKPEGLGFDKVYYNPIHFLSSKNGLIKFLFPAIYAGLVMSEMEFKRIRKNVILIIALSIWLCTSLESITSLIGIFVMLFICALTNWNKKNMKVDLQKLILIIFISCLIITIIGVSGGFVKFIGLFFNSSKISNYADRVKIWVKAVEIIEQHPIIGSGMANGGHILVNGKPMYAHNGYLEILLYGGIVGFVIFIIILKNLLFIKNRFMTKTSIYVVSCIIGFFVMMLTESHVNTLAFWGSIVIYERLISIENREKKNK